MVKSESRFSEKKEKKEKSQEREDNIRDSKVFEQQNEYKEKTETKELFNKQLYKKGRGAMEMMSPLNDKMDTSSALREDVK